MLASLLPTCSISALSKYLRDPQNRIVFFKCQTLVLFGNIYRVAPAQRFVLMEYCKDILACFQPRCRLDGSKVGKWSMLVDQLFSVGEVAPEDCQPAYLVTGVLFLAMLQVRNR